MEGENVLAFGCEKKTVPKFLTAYQRNSRHLTRDGVQESAPLL
jgi:hypothetical protein